MHNGTKNVFLELDFQLEFQLCMHIGILSVWVLNNYFDLLRTSLLRCKKN